MNGKAKCKILKDIRRQIAKDNDIAYVTSECKYQGDCSGTCPKCEAELRYLEEELRKRQNAGKAVAVAGIAAALLVTASGCNPSNLPSTQTDGTSRPSQETTTETAELIDGEIIPETVWTETEPTGNELMGVPAYEDTQQTESYGDELMGEPA